MPAGIYNTTIEQGATWQRTFVYQDAAGVPIDITGATIRMQGRSSPGASDSLYDLAVGTGITIPVGTDGRFTAVIPATTTAGFVAPGPSPRVIKFDILLSLSGSSVVSRILQGEQTVSPGVTR